MQSIFTCSQDDLKSNSQNFRNHLIVGIFNVILQFILQRTGSQCKLETIGVMRRKQYFWVSTRASVF